MNLMHLAIRVLTLGFFGKRRTAPPAVEDDQITTQDREDSRARFKAACEAHDHAIAESKQASQATMEMFPS